MGALVMRKVFLHGRSSFVAALLIVAVLAIGVSGAYGQPAPMMPLRWAKQPARARPRRPYENLILLRTEVIDTGLVALAASDRRTAAVRARMGLRATDPAYYLVQFDLPPTRADRGAVMNLGAAIVGYIPYNTYVVRAPPGQAAALRGIPGVRWTGIVAPEHKVAPELAALPAIQQRVRIVVEVFPGEQVRAVCDRIGRLSQEPVLLIQADDNARLAQLDVPVALIPRIADIVSVEWIERYYEPVLYNDIATGQTYPGSFTPTSPPEGEGLMGVKPVWIADTPITGAGQTVGHADTGLDIGANSTSLHADFRNRLAATFGLGMPVLFDTTQSAGYTGPLATGANCLDGQRVIPDRSGHVYSYRFNMARTGTDVTGTITFQLRADASGNPGTVMDTSSTFDVTNLPVHPNYGLFTVTFDDGDTVSAGTTYWVICNTNNVSGSYSLRMMFNYDSGAEKYSYNGGSSWYTGDWEMAYQQLRDSTGYCWDGDGHGTHTAGSILSNGAAYQGNGTSERGQFSGPAYEARLVHQSIGPTGSLNGIPADLNTLFQQTYRDFLVTDVYPATYKYIYSGDWVAFRFDAGEYATNLGTGSICLRLTSSGGSGNLRCALYNDSGGLPGSQVANGAATPVPASEVGTSYAVLQFTWPTPPALTPGTTYWLVLDNDTDRTCSIRWSSAASGSSATSSNDGETWTPQSYQAISFCPGARVHSDSWGGGAAGSYDTDCKNTDQFVWEHPDMCIVFSAGNDGVDNSPQDGVIDAGSVNPNGTAKNCICVGATESLRSGEGGTGTWGGYWPSDFPSDPIKSDYVSRNASDTHIGIAAFSNRGPTDDGRIKPDLVAPGTNIVSCRSHYSGAGTGWGVYNSDYVYNGGTSMAAPLVAGAAALVRQFYQDVEGINPSAALVKATLINGATNMEPGQYGTGSYEEITGWPDRSQGFGRVNVNNAINPPAPRYALFADINSQSHPGALANGETMQAFPQIQTAGSPFYVTLAWSDPPPTSLSGQKLINDLDLEVRDPSNTRYWPNGGTAADTVNNVECVRVASAAAGTWKVIVHATTVVADYSPQPFSLVLSGAFPGPTVATISAPRVLRSGSIATVLWHPSPACPLAGFHVYRRSAWSRCWTRLTDALIPYALMGPRGWVRFRDYAAIPDARYRVDAIGLGGETVCRVLAEPVTPAERRFFAPHDRPLPGLPLPPRGF